MKVKSEKEIREVCERIAKPLGLRIFGIEFKQGKNPTLTIFIDKDGGVDLDSCELFHNAINEPLDQLDPTFGLAYTLNVSSPGLDRPFLTEQDFISHIGTKVEVKLYSSVSGKKFYEGILNTYSPTEITVNVGKGKTLTFSMKNIVKVNEFIDFN